MAVGVLRKELLRHLCLRWVAVQHKGLAAVGRRQAAGTRTAMHRELAPLAGSGNLTVRRDESLRRTPGSEAVVATSFMRAHHPDTAIWGGQYLAKPASIKQ